MSPSAPGGDHGDRGGLPDADESGSGTGAEDHGALPVAGLATLLTVAVGTLAAYGITRFRFRGRELISTTML